MKPDQAVISPDQPHGDCAVCGAPTPRIGLKGHRFRQTCSRECFRELKQRTKDTSYAKRQETTMLKYGVSHISKLSETKAKVVQTNLDRFGVAHPLQSDLIKEKVARTNIERYGNVCSLHGEGVAEKTRQTNLRNIGVEYPTQSPIVQAKVAATLQEHYGVDHNMQSPAVRAEVVHTWIAKYGTSHPMQNKSIQARTKQTVIDRYGVDNVMRVDTIRNKLVTTLEDRGLTVSEKDRVDIIDLYDNNPDWSDRRITREVKWSSSVVSKTLREEHRPFRQHKRSEGEEDIALFLESHGYSVERNSNVFSDRREIDIYIPDKKFGIEYDGMFWHRDKQDGWNKQKDAADVGINLVRVFEYEWLDKPEIVKSMILAKLGSFEHRIYARDCQLEVIDAAQASDFYRLNHLHGSARAARNIGLMHNNVLVAAISIGTNRFASDGKLELIRFATRLNTQVIGGFSKLIRKVDVDITTYVDRRWTPNPHQSVYAITESQCIGETKIGYFWWSTKYGRLSRYKSQKSKLSKLFNEVIDSSKSEVQIMKEHNFYQMFDSGNYKFLIRHKC